MTEDTQKLEIIRQRLAALDTERIKLELQIAELENVEADASSEVSAQINLSVGEKIELFRRLFLGRTDVFPIRWENAKTSKSGYAIACGNEWIKGLCNKPRVKCSVCENKAFLPVTDDIIRFHLSGRNARQQPFCIGVYPMLPDETCHFLAADFDKKTWQTDVTAFVQTCVELQVPVYVERSRSGNGGHAWFFFEEAVPVPDARKLGTYLLTKTMERYPELGFESYDRLFPSQDTLPKGGLGNLIALPLQHTPRAQGNSVFLDISFKPHPDQWAFLSSIQRISSRQLKSILSNVNQVIGLPFPEDEDAGKAPWVLLPSRAQKKPSVSGPAPKLLQVVLGDQIYLSKDELSPSLRNELLRLAAFQNPEFYRSQAMRLPTFGKPRIIACAEDYPNHIALPRGLLSDLRELAESLKIDINLSDERTSGAKIQTAFIGKLTERQSAAQVALLEVVRQIWTAC